MNNLSLIKSLEAQCWESRQYGPPWFDCVKFSQLITAECIKCCATVEIDDTLSDYDGGFRDGALLCGEEIKKHFGIPR